MVFAAVVLGLTVLGYAFLGALEDRLVTPLDASGSRRIVSVPQDMDASQLLLFAAGEDLVVSSWLLDVYAHFLHTPGRLMGGEYELGPFLTPVQLIERVESGGLFEHTVALRAGSTVEEVAGVLAEAGLTDPKAFATAAHDPRRAQALGLGGPSAEGFLYPDVWALPRGLPPEELLERFVRRVFEVLPTLRSAAARLGLTPYQLVTVASLVELGPVPDEERRLYAALLIERLQKGFALEVPAADEYGRRRPGAPADPREDPWNTTDRPGLPRTPIGSPSLSSLRAAADPADTEPVFMVRRGGGRHVYCPDSACYLRALERHAPGRAPQFPKRFGNRGS